MTLKFILPFLMILFQTGAISIESKVDKNTITIGDLVKYEVIVRRDKDLKVEMPGLASNLGYFEISDYQIHDPVKVEGKIEDRVEYIISTFDTGNYVIPPISIFYTGSDSVRKELKTEKIKIRVNSVIPSEAKDIKGLRETEEIERSIRNIILYSCAGILFLLILLLLYYFYRRKKRGESLLPVKKEPPRPAHEVALEALQQLRESKLLEEGKVKVISQARKV